MSNTANIAVSYEHPLIVIEFNDNGIFRRIVLDKFQARAMLADLANKLR